MSASSRHRGEALPSGRLARAASILLLPLALVWGGCGMAFIGEEPIPRNTVFTGFSGRLVDSESGDGVGNAKVMVRPASEPDSGKPFYIYSSGDGSFQLSSYKKQGLTNPFKVGEEYQLVISDVNHRIKEFKLAFEGGEQKLGAVELLRVQEGGAVEVVIKGSLDEGESAEHPVPPRMGPPVP
jgi:hypothetical protein